MRKLKLDLEHLTVESFTTATDGVRWGTVRAASGEDGEVLEPAVGEEVAFLSLWTCKTRCNQNTCDGTCGVTCATCNDPTCDSCFVTRCRDNCA
jgi:hypothetical protein